MKDTFHFGEGESLIVAGIAEGYPSVVIGKPLYGPGEVGTTAQGQKEHLLKTGTYLVFKSPEAIKSFMDKLIEALEIYTDAKGEEEDDA